MASMFKLQFANKIWLALTFSLSAGPLWAQDHTSQELLQDIARHRAMAAAHQSMAQCLESKKDEKACLAELQLTCKGLAIGKYCGMRHGH